MMLSMAATALAQVEGGENGIDQVSSVESSAITEPIETKIAGDSTITNLVLTIYKTLKDPLGFIASIIAISSVLYAVHRRKTNRNDKILQDTIPAKQMPDTPPIDELPPRGDLPPGSHVPFSPNKVFTGREEDLLKLARSLFRSDSKGVTITQTAAVATGLGGVGKTQLAIEFCYRYGRFFHGVHWIQADHDIATEIAACGSVMDLSPWPDELEKQTNLTLQAWKGAGPRLVIFDNVEDPASVQDWLPRLPKARLLFTSRSSDWPPGLDIEHHPLGVLPPSESLELLRALAERLKDIPDAELDQVADRLGDLPLALDLAGNYLRSRPALSPKEYLAELDEAGRSILEHPAFSDWVKHNPTKHSTSLVYTFALSWDQLTDGAIDELAGRIFRACGYCAPNTPIPWELLAKTVGAEDTTQRQNLDLALNRLRGLGLITSEEGGSSIIIHPLLAEFARLQDHGVDESALSGLAQALGTLAYEANKSGLPGKMEFLREHLRTVAQAAQDAKLEIAGTLWVDLGYHLKIIADYKGAKEHCERALEIDAKVYGSDHPKVAIDFNNLGSVLEVMGDLAGAKNSYQQALEIEENVYGPDHPNVANRINNLGGVLQALGDLCGAQKNYERALEIDEKVFGPDSLEVATIVNNLGALQLAQGDLERAKKNLERGLEILKRSTGNDFNKNPNVAFTANNLCRVLHEMGDLEYAKKYIELALDIDKNIFGTNFYKNPEVAFHLDNLGSVLMDMGDLAGAKMSFEQALMIGEATLGPDHPKVAIMVNNLGLVLQDMGDLAGAKERFERALKISEKVYGPDHLQAAIHVNNLGMVLRNMGDPVGAKEHFERALKIDKKVYGPNHHSVARVVNNLGMVLYDMGELDGAKKQFKQALKIDENVYGPDHPNVARDINNVGLVLIDLGELVDAKDYFERALKIGEDVYGQDHPQVATYVNNFGEVLRNLGDLEHAKECFERAFKIDENVYGKDHLNVARDVNNLGLIMEATRDLKGAKEHYERALEIFRSRLGEDHPFTKTVRKNLESLRL